MTCWTAGGASRGRAVGLKAGAELPSGRFGCAVLGGVSPCFWQGDGQSSIQAVTLSLNSNKGLAQAGGAVSLVASATGVSGVTGVAGLVGATSVPLDVSLTGPRPRLASKRTRKRMTSRAVIMIANTLLPLLLNLSLQLPSSCSVIGPSPTLSIL